MTSLFLPEQNTKDKPFWTSPHLDLHQAPSKLLLWDYLGQINCQITKNTFFTGTAIVAPCILTCGKTLCSYVVQTWAEMRSPWVPHFQLFTTAPLLDMAVCLNKISHFILEKRKTRTAMKFIAFSWWLTPFACGARLLMLHIIYDTHSETLIIPVLVQ